MQSHDNGDPGPGGVCWDAGHYYELLECPACKGVTLRRNYYHEAIDPETPEWQILYPVAQELDGLPQSIERAYAAARKVRNIDPNAFGVLLGRVLDSVCRDRGAAGDTLHAKLQNLAAAGDIPRNLVDIAHSIRQLRNVGAHGDLGELTSAEIPLLEDLTRAILEYVYRAPMLAARAQERVKLLRAGARDTSTPGTA